jgi:hypothetical protein
MPTRGICSGVFAYMLAKTGNYITEQEQERFEALVSEWEHHSGNSLYPVPCPRDWYPKLLDDGMLLQPRVAAERVFIYAALNCLLWTGTYGALRRDLLNFLIEKTSADEA